MTSEFLKHIPEETLEQYCLGRLSETEIEPIEEHLFVCTHCQEQLAETDEFVRAVRSACDELEAEPVVEPWWKRIWAGSAAFSWKPAAAMVACALALFLVLPFRNPGSAVVDLQTMRGPEDAIEVPAGKDLTLRLAVGDATGPLEVRLADASGSPVTTAKVEKSGADAVAQVKQLRAGSYWARLYSGDQLVREYSLNVR